MNYATSLRADFFNGVEFINYSMNNIIVADPLGIKVEIPSQYDNAPSIQLRDHVVVRVTKWVDPKYITLPNKQPRFDIDRKLLDAFSEKLNKLLTRQQETGFDILHSPEMIQIEEEINFQSVDTVVKSHLFGFTIIAEKNKDYNDIYDNPENDVKKYFIPTIKELEKNSTNYDEIARTVCAVRLVDSKSVIGDLWTTIFGTATKIIACKESKLEDGVYITAGLNFEYAIHISLDKLTEKTLLGLNLHKTKYDAQTHSTGTYTKEVIEKITKLNKDHRELNIKFDKSKETIKDLNNKITTGEFKNLITINDIREKNHREIKKQGVVIEDLKRNNNRLSDENLRLKNIYSDDVKELKKEHTQTVEKIKENKTTNIVLDVFKGFGVALAGIVGAAKFFSMIKPN